MSQKQKSPPLLFLRFFQWFSKPRLRDHIEGDLAELYNERLKKSGKRMADLRFAIDVVLLFRPGIIRTGSEPSYSNSGAMYRSYFKIGWRNLVRDKGYSFINIGGLALGLAVAILIGVWVHDELSYDNTHANRDRIACVYQNLTYEGQLETMGNQSYQLGDELRNNFGNRFERVVMYYFSSSILAHDKKAFSFEGGFMEDGGPELLSLDMLQGTRAGLMDPASIMLSQTTAAALFPEGSALGKAVRIDNSVDLTVTGIYKDLPPNSSFSRNKFFVPLKVMIDRGGRNFGWVNNWLLVFVQLADNTDMQAASEAIKGVKLKNVDPYEKRYNPELFLFPMNEWRLYDEFNGGINTGGRIDLVRLFCGIGVFVLLLACINFMNLSTARYQKRAKEVGIRKVIGSARGQLIRQFYAESLLVVILSTVFALGVAQVCLPVFNDIAGKAISLPWRDVVFLSFLIAFIVLTVVVSGSYPALYLSSLSPVKVLKGTSKAGRLASTPRRILVVTQFTVSIVLAIGTIIVYQQIEHVRQRPTGYDLSGLITIPIKTNEVKKNYQAFRNDLLASSVAVECAASETTVMNMWWSDSGMLWKGKDPNLQDIIFRGAIDYDFGKTVGWTIKEGRDFSREFATDSSAMILNESAVAYMGLEHPVGEVIRTYGKEYTVIGVVKDMITQSLFYPTKQTIFILSPVRRAEFISVKTNPQLSTNEALIQVERIFAKHHPDTPFEYSFADDEFAEKFSFEQHFGKLVGVFSALAIFISCLGLFGLSSFVAEQRTKEIGVRKVLGASITNVWQLLSRDFAVLVVVAVLLASPLAYYFMTGWLENYQYRMEIDWWVFVAAGLGALLVTLLTVSFQAIRAAMANPVQSLRSE
jgi:putative ABC transport system permease protein